MIWHFMQIVSIGDNLHEMSNSVIWENMFLFFPENRIWYVMQTVSYFHEMSNPVFLGNMKNIIHFVVCWICPESGKG